MNCKENALQFVYSVNLSISHSTVYNAAVKVSNFDIGIAILEKSLSAKDHHFTTGKRKTNFAKYWP